MMPSEPLREMFDASLRESPLRIEYRFRQPSLWMETTRRLLYQPVAYDASIIDYNIAYHCSGYPYGREDIELVDLSLILFNGQTPCGVWPLNLDHSSAGLRLSSYGGHVLPPLFVKATSPRTEKRLVRQCIDLLNRFCTRHGIESWVSHELFTNRCGLSEWHRYLMSLGAHAQLMHELYVDLQADLNTIKTSVRNSFRPLITLGERLWKTRVLDAANPAVWAEYRALHQAVSGRTTRSDLTWDLQLKSIENGNAFLVYLRDFDNRMVGGGFFSLTRDEGYYGVGVYDRNIFDKPIGHVVQWNAIQELKRRGALWHRIGRRHFPSDIPIPTAKELSIAHFKEGFATHLHPLFVVTWAADSSTQGAHDGPDL